MFYDFMVAPFASPPIPMMDGLGVFVYAQFASPTEIGSFQTLGCMSYFQSDPDFDGPLAPSITNYFGQSSFKGKLTDYFQTYQATVVDQFQAEYDIQGPWQAATNYKEAAFASQAFQLGNDTIYTQKCGAGRTVDEEAGRFEMKSQTAYQAHFGYKIYMPE